MIKHIDTLTRSVLFKDIPRHTIPDILSAVDARVDSFAKGDEALAFGDGVQEIVIILSGALQLSKRSVLGEMAALRNMHAGDMFGHAHACVAAGSSDLRAEALTETELLFLDYQKLLRGCVGDFPQHSLLLHNICADIARENLEQARKIDYMMIKSMRRRIYAYLQDEYHRAGRNEFEIPYDRTALAQYLNVDRSALSRELSRMRQDGVVSFHKNTFSMLTRLED